MLMMHGDSMGNCGICDVVAFASVFMGKGRSIFPPLTLSIGLSVKGLKSLGWNWLKRGGDSVLTVKSAIH